MYLLKNKSSCARSGKRSGQVIEPIHFCVNLRPKKSPLDCHAKMPRRYHLHASTACCWDPHLSKLDPYNKFLQRVYASCTTNNVFVKQKLQIPLDGNSTKHTSRGTVFCGLFQCLHAVCCFQEFQRCDG